jgi:hypothetical protein
MVIGTLNDRILRTGLSVVAALLLSTAAFAQDADGTPEISDDAVTMPVDDSGMVQGDEGPAEGGPDEEINVDIFTTYVVDEVPGDESAGDDGAGDNDWVDDGSGDDGWIDICNTVVCGEDGEPIVGEPGDGGWVDEAPGEEGAGDEGTGDEGTGDDGWVYIDDGEVVIYYLDGVRPLDCPECRDITLDLPVEAYQMSAGGLSDLDAQAGVDVPAVNDVVAAKPTKSRKSRGAASYVGTQADCLAQHPQLPWMCEWQNGAGQ